MRRRFTARSRGYDPLARGRSVSRRLHTNPRDRAQLPIRLRRPARQQYGGHVVHNHAERRQPLLRRRDDVRRVWSFAMLRAFDADREYGAAERHADGRLPPLAMLRVCRILLLYYKRCETYVNQDVLLGLLESVGSVELTAPVLRQLTADVEAYAAPQQNRCLPASTRSASKRSRRADLQRRRNPLRRAAVRQSVVEVNARPSERRTMRSPSTDPCACSKAIPSRRRSCITLLALLKKSINFSCDAKERFVYSNYYAYLTQVVYSLACSVSVATTLDITGRLYQLV